MLLPNNRPIVTKVKSDKNFKDRLLGRRSVRAQRRRLALPLGVFLAAFLTYQGLILFHVIGLRYQNSNSTAFIEQRRRELTNQGKVFQPHIVWMPYESISPYLIHAVVREEDFRFWRHPGFDPKSMWRALKEDWKARSLVRGASTLDQQLAKNLFFSPVKNPLRKLEEIIVAVEMEICMPKTRIIEIYLNIIEWGDGIYGVEAAAEHYFQTSASKLNREQSAYLTGMIPAPRGVTIPLESSPQLQQRANEIMRDLQPFHVEGLVSINFDDGYQSADKLGVTGPRF